MEDAIEKSYGILLNDVTLKLIVQDGTSYLDLVFLQIKAEDKALYW